MWNMLILWTFATLLSPFASTYAAEVTEGGYPILWDKATDDPAGLPTADGAIALDPWDYVQRMSMYKLILNTTEKYMRSMGTSPSDSPLWSLPLQLGWKLKSGRLADPTGVTNCGKEADDPMYISTQSWWACVNYFQSVIPFLAAVETGIIGQGLTIQILGPSQVDQYYCTSFPDCSSKYPELMSSWQAFFQTLKNLSTSDISDHEKKSRILESMWEAEQISLLTATNCEPLGKHHSSPEKAFRRSWIYSGDFVAATRFQASIERAVPLMRPLPSRVLQETDKAPNIPDLSDEENHTLYIFSWMDSVNTFLGGALVKLWRNAMCSDAAREKGQEVLHDLVLNPTFAVSGLMSIITDLSSSC